jgi:hypothetical protein
MTELTKEDKAKCRKMMELNIRRTTDADVTDVDLKDHRIWWERLETDTREELTAWWRKTWREENMKPGDRPEKPKLGSRWVAKRGINWDFSGRVQGVCNWDHADDHAFPPLVVFLTAFRRFTAVSALEVRDRLREVDK